MNQRSYNQFCPVAYALDLVGERWTMLVIRELSFGPRRFVDILRGLPGIGTNLLARRLRLLEGSHIIYRRHLPPPAASAVYELAEAGKRLLPVLQGLANWGLQLISEAAPDDYLGFVSTMGAIATMYLPRKPAGKAFLCEIRTPEGTFHTRLNGPEIEVEQGEALKPDLVISVESKVLISLLGIPENAARACDEDLLHIERGGLRDLKRFLNSFASPTGTKGNKRKAR